MIKTKDGRILNLERLTWFAVRERILKLNPELVSIINELDIDDRFPIYIARYPFGAQIINNSIAYLPLTTGHTISFNDPELPNSILDDLSYDPNFSNPLGMILNRNCESYISLGDRILPNMVLSPGEIFGSARILNNVMRSRAKQINQIPIISDINAGTKSALLLPKISDAIGINKLNKYVGCHLDKPNSYQDHNHIFSEIAYKQEANWTIEILFFSNHWLNKLKDAAWAEFYGYLSEIRQQSNKLWHNAPRWTAVFCEIENSKRLSHYSSYVIGTARHLFAIAAGSAPGYQPAIDDSFIPSKIIQDAFINGYELTDYWPVIMVPGQYSTTNNSPLYYSLNYPTLAQYNPDTYKGKSIITLTKEVQEVVQKYQSEILNSITAKNNAPSLYNAAANVEFNYYHGDPKNCEMIKLSSLIPDEDIRFKYAEAGEFPSHSPFLKGCIKISRITK